MIEPLRTIARIFKRIAEITFDALISGIKTLIDWLSKIHIPKLPDWVPGIGGRAVSSVSAVGATSRAGSPVATSSTGALTINVFGALDAEGTARQIRRLLDAHERRAGRLA